MYKAGLRAVVWPWLRHQYSKAEWIKEMREDSKSEVKIEHGQSVQGFGHSLLSKAHLRFGSPQRARSTNDLKNTFSVLSLCLSTAQA